MGQEPGGSHGLQPGTQSQAHLGASLGKALPPKATPEPYRSPLGQLQRSLGGSVLQATQGRGGSCPMWRMQSCLTGKASLVRGHLDPLPAPGSRVTKGRVRA